MLDFIERHIGFSPDGGDGTFEVLIIIVTVRQSCCSPCFSLIRAEPSATQPNKRMPRDSRMTFLGNEARKIYVNVIGLTIFLR
jgi:hypothetical protein